MPRGGKRTGTPGQNYSNRSDLNAHQPIRVAPSQTYGQGVQQQQAQAQIPLPQQPAPGAAPQMPPPTPLTAPTTRPQEPLTSGIASGPGPGPSALASPDPLVKAAAALNALGDQADPQTRQLRALVNASLNNQSAA